MAIPRLLVALPQEVGGRGHHVIGSFAARVEAAGFAGVCAMDNGVGVTTSAAPLVDPLLALAVAAVATTRVRLLVAVLPAGRRNAAQLARDAASLDALSDGRFVLGLGVGNDPASVEQLGFAARRRGDLLEDTIGAMRALWRHDRASYDGAVLRFDDVAMGLTPAAPLPVWIGAGQPPALERAARIADGWIGAGSSPVAAFADQVRFLREALARFGRPEDFPVARRLYLDVAPSVREGRARLTERLDGFYGWPGLTERAGVAGPPELIADTIRRLADDGATDVVLNPLADWDEQLERLVEVRRLLG